MGSIAPQPGCTLRRLAAICAIITVGGLTLAGCTSQVAGSGSPVAVVTVTESAGGGADTPASVPVPSSGAIVRQKIPGACTVLSRSEATALAGKDLEAGVAAGNENGQATLCNYTRDPNADGIAQVTIIVGDGAKKALDIDKDNLKHKFTKVPGIGDETWQEDDSIFVLKGTTWAEIALVLLNDPSANVQPLRQAAKLAAGRL